MSGHADRAHSSISPSGAHRWMQCTPSAALEAQFPDVSSEYAEEGTLAHEFCELKLRSYFEVMPKKTRTTKLNKLKKHELYKAEIDTCSDFYAEHIKRITLAMPSAPFVAIEQEVDLTDWIPDGKGIADCVIVHGDMLYVVDYKHGKGVRVSAENNPQLMLYALGVHKLLAILYPITKVKLVIVQPRISEEVSEWEISVEHLLSFGEWVKERAALAVNGGGEYAPSEEACRFCKARQTCRARSDYNVRLAFETKDDKPVTDFDAPTLTLDEIGKYLSWGTDIAAWLSDLKEYALSQTLAGNEVTGWKAVEGRSSRRWTDQEAAFNALKAASFPESLLYETVTRSLATIEKDVGKKAFNELVGEYIEKVPGKPTLVLASDKRSAISNVTKAFDVFND